MDQLSKMLQNYSFNVDVFFSGNKCGIHNLVSPNNNKGHLHLLKSGALTIKCEQGHSLVLDKPSVIFIPGPSQHQIITSESSGVELVCASVEFNSSAATSLVSTLPKLICLDIDKNNSVGKTALWLFKEAFIDQPGRQVIIDKLGDIFIIQILRHILAEGLVVQGMLSAMSHPKLSPLMLAVHQQPDRPWTIDSMADIALMSRAKFAVLFKETVGQAPNEYLTDLRIAKAQGLLTQNKPVSLVANAVGYEHGSTLAKVFRKKLGITPKEWQLKFKVS